MTVDVLFFQYITRVNNLIEQICPLWFFSIIFRIYVKYNVITMPSTYATSMDFVHMNKLWKLTMHVTLMKIKYHCDIAHELFIGLNVTLPWRIMWRKKQWMEFIVWTNVISTLTSLMTSPEVSTYAEYHLRAASSPAIRVHHKRLT